MKTKMILSVVVSCILMSGCAVKTDKTQVNGLGLTYQSDVKKLVDGNYYTEIEAAPAAGRIDGAIGAANKKASDFCRVQNKSMKVIKTDFDSHLLVNGVARLTFTCI